MEEMIRKSFKIIARVEAGRVQNVEFQLNETEAKRLAYDYGTMEVHNGENVRQIEDISGEEKENITKEIERQLPIARMVSINNSTPEAAQPLEQQ